MSKKILIVEDEGIVALDMQARLNRLGYQCVGIPNSGEDAIKLAAEHRPDVALMDIRLRGNMDGVETAQQLRVQFDIPVVYLTAYTDETTLQRAKVTEPLGYLVKPFEERELSSTLEMALYKLEMDRRSQAQTAQLQRVVATVPEGVVLLDAEHRIALANAKALDYLTVLAGASAGDIVYRLGDYPIEQLLSNLQGEVWQEIKVSVPSLRVFEVTSAPSHPDSEPSDHNPVEWVLVIREVTSERQMQQLIQSQDRLAAIGQLAAGIAHDFNNILASIVLWPSLIQSMEPHMSAKSREGLEIIASQAKRGSDLVQQILDFSRKSVTEMQPFDLQPLLQELTRMLERVLPDNIHFELITRSGDYMIQGDPTRILQMLLNLALNARDAVPNGGNLYVELTRLSRGDAHWDALPPHDQWIRINVTDDGTGIQPDILPHIFEPFFTTKSAGGTGLGLAQVYGIVQQHEGHVHVDSQPGQGTTFSIYFPALNALSSNNVHPDDQQDPLIEGNQQTILIADDNLNVRKSLSECVEFLSYKVLAAANGLEVLAILEQPQNRVDLILSDLDMPEMTGLELCREVRGKNSNIPIIILSGYISDENIKELKAFGVEWIHKPVSIEHLSNAIERAVKTP